MTTYRTADVAEMIGIHPNTVRLYEELKLIPKPERRANGYRVFTDFHIEQCRLIRTAFRVEVLQNGLRGKIVQAVKASATRDFDTAMMLIHEYLRQIKQEQSNAEEAIELVGQLLSDGSQTHAESFTRKEASETLEISMGALRNWERNGLLSVKRKNNGYRVYTDEDIKRLKIIRSLRCSGYSLEAIFRLLRQLSGDPDTDVRAALNTPKQSDEIISACDTLIVSLSAAEQNADKVFGMLQDMKIRFS